VDRQVVAPSAVAARETATAAGFPARDVAVTERRVDGIREGAEGARSPGAARIVDYEAERVVVETDSRGRALLVLTDSWFPGWKAKVDGDDADVHRVDYVIRGVSVPAGSHRVEFTYAPASWRAGWIVSGVALLVVLGAAALGWRRRGPGQPRHIPATAGMFEK
jgi:Bacterial membrane protein YfhO